MFSTLITLVKTAAILIVAGFALVLAAWAEHIIVFVLVLFTIGILSFVVLHNPDS